ncbi:hypothetical protein V8F20_005116 [Naviculisporaceae sp. PSN 640]
MLSSNLTHHTTNIQIPPLIPNTIRSYQIAKDTMTKQEKEPGNRTYFLAPGWDIPSSPDLLGSIVIKPSEPDSPFFRPSTALASAANDTSTLSSPISLDSSSTELPSAGTSGLFSIFLLNCGLGDEPVFTYDRKRVLSYSFRQQSHAEITPSPELLQAAVAEPRVKELLSSKVGVYMITGFRSITGASVKLASTKGEGWSVELGVGSANNEQDPSKTQRIFALQVAEVKVKDGGEVGLSQLSSDADVLQKVLDWNFGEGTYKVTKGFDEVAVASGKTENECLIVTPSPIFVDPLTASTRKVGGEHGIWY